MRPDLDDHAFDPEALAHMRSIRREIEDAVAEAAHAGVQSGREPQTGEGPVESTTEDPLERIASALEAIAECLTNTEDFKGDHPSILHVVASVLDEMTGWQANG